MLIVDIIIKTIGLAFVGLMIYEIYQLHKEFKNDKEKNKNHFIIPFSIVFVIAMTSMILDGSNVLEIILMIILTIGLTFVIWINRPSKP